MFKNSIFFDNISDEISEVYKMIIDRRAIKNFPNFTINFFT